MDGKTILLPQDLPATTRLLNPATGRRQSAKHILQRLGCKLPSTQDQRLVLDEHIEARTPEAASNTEMIDLAGFGLLGTERSVVEVLEQIESQRKSRELKLATHEDVEPADPNTTRDKVAQWFGITEAAWFQMCTNPKSIFDAYATRVADELNFKPINFTDIAHIVRVEHFDEDERDLMTTVPSAAASEQLLDKLLDLYNAIPDLPGFDLTKQYFFEYTFFLFKCSRIKGQEALRSDRFLEFLINSYAKSSNEISLTYIEKLLETQVPYLGESSAREILAIAKDRYQLSNDLAQMIFYKFGQRNHAKGLELALEYDSQSKLEDLSYDELCHGMEHYCRKALNKTRILCPSGTESGNLGIEIEVDHNYENTDLASERKIYDDVYEKYEDLVEIGVDGGENLDEIRSLNSSSKEKQGGFVLDRECQERLTQLSHELSFHPDFRTFETVHINVDSAVNMSAQNSIFNFRNDNGSYWESKEAPVSVVRLHQSKRRMPNLFRMSRYIDQLQLVSALRDVRWRDIGKEELTQIFSEEERAEFSAMLEGDQRPIAKLLIYIADKHDRRDLYAPILRLLAEKSIPSLKSSLMARFFNLCPDPYSQSFLQELARIVTREIEAIGETDEETDNQLAYLNEVVGTRNIKDSPALRALMVDTSINANAREIIFRNCGEIDPVTLFDPELELYCFEDESVLSPNEGDHETILKRIRENPDPDRLEDILSLIAKEVSFSLEDPNLLDFIKDESIDEEVRDLVIEQLIAPVSTGLVERLGLDLKKFFDLDRISGSTPISLSPAMVGLINNDCLGKNYKSVLAEKLEGSSGLHYTVAELKAAGIKDPSWLIVNGTNLKLEPNSIDFADMGTERWGWPLTETKGVEVAEALRPISLEELREIHQQETLFERIKFAVTQRFEQKLSFEEAHRHNLDLALLLKADRIKEPIKFSREFRDAIVDLPPSQSSKNPELYRRLIYSLEQPLSHDQFFAFYQKLVDLFHHTSHFGPLAADLISKLEQPINCEELRARNYSPFLFLLADKLTGIVNLDDTAISILEKKSNHPEIQKTLRQAQRRLLSLLESDLELNDQIRDLLGNTKIELEHRLELARKLKDGIDVKTVRRYLADPWILSERIKGIIASKRKSLVERLPTYKL